MASIDSLPADQRAVLQLLLKQGKSYDELSGLLRIDPTAVRERAHAAVQALGPEGASQLPADRRAEIADYLLGQQSASTRAATREYLGGSAGGRAWARTTAGQLRPLAGESLPEIPAEGAEVDEAFGALQARTARREDVQRSSRLGGILLLAGIGVALAVALILILGGGDDKGNGVATPRAGDTPTTQTTAAGRPQVLDQINLRPPQGSGSKALGVALILRQGGQLGLALNLEGLRPASRGSAYAVWLFDSASKTRRLGFIQNAVGNDGRLQSVSAFEQPPTGFKSILLTRETGSNPRSPGTTILRGDIHQRAVQGAGSGAAQGTSTQPQGTGTAP